MFCFSFFLGRRNSSSSSSSWDSEAVEEAAYS
jgi:hypothetical protein